MNKIWIANTLKAMLVPLLMLVSVSQTPAENSGYWFDLLTEDAAQVQPFYQELFGWQVKLQDSEYWLVMQGETVIGGMAQIENQQADADESLWLFALPVDNVEKALEVAVLNGATPHQPIDTAPGIGRYAVILDPQGAPVTLREAPAFANHNNIPGQWGWAELWTDNIVDADLFYSKFGNNQIRQASVDDEVHQYFSQNNITWGSIIQTPFADVKPIWVPYVVVEDVKQIVEKTKSAGGTVLVPPQENFSDGKVALLQDPSGAAFLIQAQDMEGEK